MQLSFCDLGPRGSKDKSKEWQLEMLMEKLRSKANQYRSFQQSAKDLRMALLVSVFIFSVLCL